MQRHKQTTKKTSTDHIGLDDSSKLYIPNNQRSFAATVFSDCISKLQTGTITMPRNRLVVELYELEQKHNLVRKIA
jgi:hypothetical protein